MPFPQYAAEQVINELNIVCLEDLQDLDLIAFARGALVRENKLDGAEARLTVFGNRAVITVSPTGHLHRQRFSIAHELGHLEMHRYKTTLAICTNQNLIDWRLQAGNIEQEANEFAAALLLPRQFFAHLCKEDAPSLDFVAILAKTFNVSLTATALRFLDFCGEPCAVVFSQNKTVRWFRSSKEFQDVGVFIETRSRLDPASLAVSYFEKRATQKTPKRVKASAWFAPGSYRHNATISEQSWVMSNYNAVLTLIWVDDDIEDDENWFD